MEEVAGKVGGEGNYYLDQFFQKKKNDSISILKKIVMIIFLCI